MAIFIGIGNDNYIVDSLLDNVNETSNIFGGGVDRIYSSISYNLSIAQGNSTALSLAQVDNLTLTGSAVSGTGNALNNSIIGNSLSNNLSGGDGNDNLSGGAGKQIELTGAPALFVNTALPATTDILL